MTGTEEMKEIRTHILATKHSINLEDCIKAVTLLTGWGCTVWNTYPWSNITKIRSLQAEHHLQSRYKIYVHILCLFLIIKGEASLSKYYTICLIWLISIFASSFDPKYVYPRQKYSATCKIWIHIVLPADYCNTSIDTSISPSTLHVVNTCTDKSVFNFKFAIHATFLEFSSIYYCSHLHMVISLRIQHLNLLL